MATQNKSKVPIGTLLEEKFRVTKEIGRGGMAAVYEALNIDIGKRVAVKVLAAELITSRIVRERFIREARAAAAVRSPYICDVYDSGMYEERPFLVMELLEGESLYDMLTRVRRIDVETTLTMATQAARGLSKTHAVNIIHRDLKPENIFLTHDEEGRMLAKILDFGLAKFYEPTVDKQTVRLTREGALFGTPAYMSPEQAKGQGEVDARADLWALACIVYECLTGHTVWNVDQGVAMILAQIANAPLPRPSRLRPDLPPSFDEWFLRALDRDPDHRFQTAREFSESLSAALRPGTALLRRSLPSAQEAREVDELIASSPQSSPAPPSGPRAQAPPTEPYAQPSISDLTPPAQEEAPSRRPIESSGRAVVTLVLAAVGALGAYAAWLYVVHPPPETRAAVATPTPAASASAAAAHRLEPAERESYALQIGAAQERLAKGEANNAVTLFREAFANGGTSVARSLLAHAEAAFESPDGKCKLSGLGRPRPFELGSPASRPTLVHTQAGSVTAWVDNHVDSSRRQAFSVLLDPALRRATPPRLVTPEAESVRHPELISTGDRIAFIYWDGAGEEPGVYVRMLDPDGRIAGPTRRISAVRRHEFNPALTRAEDGTFWAVWEEELGGGATDLMGRHLGAALEPLSDAVRLTALVPRRGVTTTASKPDIAISRGRLHVIFTQERGQKQQIMLLHVALGDAALASGLGLEDIGPNAKRKPAQDRYVGSVLPIGTPYGKSAQPRVACSATGCFAVWDDEKRGAFAAFIDPESGQALWHREFASKGQRPALAATATEVVVAYYDNLRVKLARIDRDGLGPPSSVARVSGYQPYPAIVAGPEPGQWYISWRDYEAGHYEAFVARVQCQT